MITHLSRTFWDSMLLKKLADGLAPFPCGLASERYRICPTGVGSAACYGKTLADGLVSRWFYLSCNENFIGLFSFVRCRVYLP